MNSLRPDVVLDCNVLVQAVVRQTGPAAQILRLVEQNRVTLHVSKAILREPRRTLAYPEVRQRNPQLTDELTADLLREIVFRGVLHTAVPHVFEYARDPGNRHT